MEAKDPKCAYDTVADLLWLEQMRRIIPTQAGNVFSLHEPCPRCTHTLTWQTEDVIESLGTATLRAASRTFRLPAARLHTPGEVYVACNCQEPHGGRPPDQLGCGQAGLLNFWSEPPTARPADSEYTLWAQQAEKEDLQAVSGIRSTAEKWAGSIAALTGAFGIAAFLKTPTDISALSQTGQSLLLVSLGVAVVLDMGAIGCAAVAAQGTPQATWTNAASYKAASRTAAVQAANLLKWSRFLTIATLLALFLGAALLWSGRPAAPSSAASPLLVTEDGHLVCGQPQVASDGTVGLRVPGGGTPVPLAGVTNIMAVGKC